MTKYPILGANVDAVEMDDAVEIILSAARESRPLGVSALAVHGVMEAVKDPELQYRINELELVVPDGQPVRWGLNWIHGSGLVERVSGVDLVDNLLARAEEEDMAVFFFGSTAEVLAAITRSVAARHPNLTIGGIRPSRFRSTTESERTVDLEVIRESGAGIVFVGLGCPRQEIWTYENRVALGRPILAVGAAFEILAARRGRAPVWMQRSGLEWLYRLKQEPSRLWSRYLLLNPAYLTLLVLQRLGIASISAERSRRPQAYVGPG